MTEPGASNADLGQTLEGAVRGPALPAHLYLHVPFCASKCAYCDFASEVPADDTVVRAVFSGMRAEIVRWAAACLPGVIETVYVGGGTPSLFAVNVAETLDWVRERLPIRDGAEITVEANPDSIDAAALDVLVGAGVNRISLGVQSFDDGVLAFLGRRHDATAAWRACEHVRERGVEFSVDVMCGMPRGVGRSDDHWRRTVGAAAATGARHISVYPLQVEDGTALARRVEAGGVTLPDEDEVAAELVLARDILEARGVRRYEVANYATPGHESRHNSAYWLGSPYIGVEPAAHGMLDIATAEVLGLAEDAPADAARVRYAQPASVEGWMTGEVTGIEMLSEDETAREDVMLGLRLVEGVSVAAADRAGLGRVMDSLAADGLVERVRGAGGQRWAVTERGWLLGNEVFGRVWLADT